MKTDRATNANLRFYRAASWHWLAVHKLLIFLHKVYPKTKARCFCKQRA